MQYTWSHHAASDRLPERSSLSRKEIEHMLNERRYVVPRKHRGEMQDRHLLWDPRGHLIDVPVTADGVIPSILPVTYGSGYNEWDRAQAERAWRGEDFFSDSHEVSEDILSWVQVVLARKWKIPTHWNPDLFHTREADVMTLLFWPIRDPHIAQTGDDGVLALFHERTFRKTMKVLIEEWTPYFHTVIPEGNVPAIHIKKFGAHRICPIDFFVTL